MFKNHTLCLNTKTFFPFLATILRYAPEFIDDKEVTDDMYDCLERMEDDLEVKGKIDY